jgi:aspartate/methionine/tyrosine aminotransferase
MSYPTSPFVAAAIEPPVAEAKGWIAGREFPPEKPLLDLAQAVPAYPPAAALSEHLAGLVTLPETSRYTEIAGLVELREALARHMSAVYEGAIAPARCFVTAGCNQAYCLAVMALARAGDEVILPLPYYFNHQMWLDMLGVRARHLAFRPDRGGVPDADEAAALITERTRAIVLVTPNNPTGAVYPPEVIESFYELARARDLPLLLDETYKDFLDPAGPAHGLFRRPDWEHTLVQLYSFSKAYSLTGYRVGSVIAGPEMLAAVKKIMDTVSICASRIGQDAALFGLRELGHWREDKRRMIAERVAALRRAFGRNDLRYRLLSAGAFFAYVQHPFAGEAADQVARRLAQEQNLLCLPGTMFGPDQEDYLRFAFANVEPEAMEELAARLVASQEG